MAAAAAAGIVVSVVAAVIAAGFYSVVITNSRLHDPLPLDLPRPPSVRDFPAPRNDLERMERIGQGYIPGAEDLAVDRDGRFLYGACSDGWIRRISLADFSVKNWSYIGGRPLGIAAGLSENEMLVCEPEMGLLSVTESEVRVLSSEADGLSYKLADGLDVARDGTIYFTDASTSYGLHDFDLDLLEGRPYGRLLKFDPHTNQTTVLLEELYFPNGVALSKDEDFLVFCETAQARTKRYWLRGDKTGTSEVFTDNLPGLPDNVHRFENQFWIALLGRRSAWWEAAMRFPILKHLMGTQKLLLKHLHSSDARILVVDEGGTSVDMYESLQSSSIGFMTTGMRIGDFAYVGSLSANYIGRIPIH